jgi:ribosomal protein S18 acetylase RimI-like enzyme
MVGVQPVRSAVPRSRPLTVRRIPWPPVGMTAEILRLLMFYPHSDRHLKAMGFSMEDIAAYHYAGLGVPGGVLAVAERGRRLEGLVLLAPETWPSVMLKCHIWSIRSLFLSPDATPRTAVALVNNALTLIKEPVDFLSADLPTSDLPAIDGLRELGFRVVAKQDQAVAACRESATKRTQEPAFVPMDMHHLDPATLMLRDCFLHSDYEFDPAFDAEDLAILRHLLLFRYMQDPNTGILVAQNSHGPILGLIGYRLDLCAKEYALHRTASIDYLAIRPDMHSNGLGETLNGQVMAELRRRSVQAVSVSISTPSPEATMTLETLRRSGYRLTSSSLAMHCWPKGSEWSQACDWYAA